jgi:hypothetical protein
MVENTDELPDVALVALYPVPPEPPPPTVTVKLTPAVTDN